MTETATKPKRRSRKRTAAPVLVTMILDRSGSMGSVLDETIEAVNTYVGQLRDDEGETLFTLRLFDDRHDVVCDAVPVDAAPLIDRTNYVPRGSTALNDAIGLGISAAAASKVSEDTRHLVVIVTDGYENASREHTPETIKTLVGTQEALGWTFVFLQGNLDLQSARQTAAVYGVSAGNVAVYDTSVGDSTYDAVVATSAISRAVSCAAPGTSLLNAYADSGIDPDFSGVGRKK